MSNEVAVILAKDTYVFLLLIDTLGQLEWKFSPKVVHEDKDWSVHWHQDELGQFRKWNTWWCPRATCYYR